jgi:hypothetical protein
MKKKLLYLLLMVSGVVSAQNVNIPDPVFKGILLSSTPFNEIAKNSNGVAVSIDSNGDGEIQISEAHNIWELNLIGSPIITYFVDITNVNGLEQFQNLRNISIQGFRFDSPEIDLTALPNITKATCIYNNIESLDVSGLVNLQKLDCSRNSLQSLDLTGLSGLVELNCEYNYSDSNDFLNEVILAGNVNLQKMNCAGNNITALDFTDCINLKQLTCSFNNLSSINLAGLSQLTHISCDGNNISGPVDLTVTNQLLLVNLANNNITELNLGNQPNLTYLFCNSNNLAVLDLQGLPMLFSLNVNDNNLTSIDLSFCPQINFIRLRENPLGYVNLKNGTLMQYGMIDYFTISHSGSLPIYVCVDEGEEDVASTYFEIWDVLDYLILTSYCTFTPGGNYNTISGTFTFDSDNNGCSVSDLAQPNIKIAINSGTQTGSAVTDVDGNYSFYTQAGAFTVTPQLENSTLFTVTPTSATVSFADVNNNIATQNFCITPNGNHPDVEVVVVPLGVAQPGFDAYYKIIYKNKGNQNLSGAVNFTYDDAVLDYVSAAPAYASSSTGQLGWNYSNLLPFESRGIIVSLNINGPMETPPVNNGDFLNYSVAITPTAGDETPADNIINFNQLVVGSFDPNDITCLEGEIVHPDKIGHYLHYNINFENTGTAPATFIVVKDVIDAQKFDISSLQVLNASHNLETRVTGNKIEFIFDDINLGAQGKGNVTFKIKTKPTVAVNSTVTQKADIFFDYNWPITTNDANTTFTVLSHDNFAVDNTVKVYPNPAKNIVNIEAGSELQSVQLYDVQGRLLQSLSAEGTGTVLDLSSKPAGIYFIKINTEKGAKVEKVIKE